MYHGIKSEFLQEYLKEEKKSLFAFFDLRGYILIFFMMGLGISLKHIHVMPTEFFAGFYSGLGVALFIAGIRYFVSWWKSEWRVDSPATRRKDAR